MDSFKIGDICIDVEKRDIKNMYIRILPPFGKVIAVVPTSISNDAIKMFAISKIHLIKVQVNKFKEQERQTRRAYVSGETFYLWGRAYRLDVIYSNFKNDVYIKGDRLILQVREESNIAQREKTINNWYRKELLEAIEKKVEKFQLLVGVNANEYKIKNMITKWGTCNIDKRRIWINLQLAKKTPECLDYVIVHELVHLLEKNHTDKFKSLMNKFYPNWETVKKSLNQQKLDDLTQQ